MENRSRMEGSSDSQFDELDLEVADILINFADSVLKSECSKAVSPSWCVKRKRSALRKSSTLQLRSPPLFPSPAALPPVGFEVTKSVEVNAEEAPSPNSILLFPPAPESSESDEKSNLCLPRNSKKAREELVEEIEGLSRFRDMLRMEVEKVKSHYDKLLARNTQLKSLRQEVFSSRAPHCGGGREQLHLGKPESKSIFGSDLRTNNPIGLPGQQLMHIHHPTVMLDSQGREPFQFITTRQVSQPLISSSPYVNTDLSISFGVDPAPAPAPARTWEFFSAKRAKYAEARMYRMKKRALRR